MDGYRDIPERYESLVMSGEEIPDAVIESGAGACARLYGGGELLDFASGGVVGFGDEQVSQAIVEAARLLSTAGCADSSGVDCAELLCRAAGCDSVVFADDDHDALARAVELAQNYSRTRYGEGRNRVIKLCGQAIAFDDPSICAVVFEPTDASGRMMSQEHLLRLLTAAAENDIIVIADERHSGVMRSGSFSACSENGLKADITLVSGLGGGFSFSALAVSGEAAKASAASAHISPIVFSAAARVLRILSAKGCGDAVRSKGKLLLDCLTARSDLGLSDIRGYGLLVSAECDNARALRRASLENGVLCAVCGSRIILRPPLCVTEEQIVTACRLLKR